MHDVIATKIVRQTGSFIRLLGRMIGHYKRLFLKFLSNSDTGNLKTFYFEIYGFVYFDTNYEKTKSPI